MQLDTANWSGDGEFTQRLIDAVKEVGAVAVLRVEDAPSTRVESGYTFISNELFVGFEAKEKRRFGPLPWGVTLEKSMTFTEFQDALDRTEGIGRADYADETMIQYLRTERIIPPYQTRGYKLVELVRIYEVGTVPRRD